MKRRYVLTVVNTSHTLINNEMHNWLNRVFMSLLSPLAEPADNESETDGHLTRMGPRLIMNICLIFPDPVFSQCKVANSELLLHNHTCAQLSFCFYPRPVLAFGYCHRLRLCVCPCVCVCVYQSLACPHDNSSAVQARITKFGWEMQNTTVKKPIILGNDRPWPLRSNLTWKSNFASFWACLHNNFSLV